MLDSFDLRGSPISPPAANFSRSSAARAAMALCALSDDALGVVFEGMRNVLDPRVVVDSSSASRELWEPTQAMRHQLKSEYEAAASLCLKIGVRSCKELREVKVVRLVNKDLVADDLATLGSLGSVLPALETLTLVSLDVGSGPDGQAFTVGGQVLTGPGGMQRLAAGLGAGALLALISIDLFDTYMGDAGAEAFAAALGRGAMPRLETLSLNDAAIGDAGLVALAPGLRRLPALRTLTLVSNPFGDGGVAALLAPPPPAGALLPPAGALLPPTSALPLPAAALPPPTQGLAKLQLLDFSFCQVADVGCAALVAALDSGALPALKFLDLAGPRCASTAAFDAVFGAFAAHEEAKYMKYIRAVSGNMLALPA